MEKQEIKEKLRELLAIVDAERAREAELRDDTPIREGLGLDSLQIAELLFEIEEKVDVKIADQEAQALRTVGDLVNLIQNRVSGA